jgi:hypothetical protein
MLTIVEAQCIAENEVNTKNMPIMGQYFTEFYILLTVHHVMILGK